MPLRTWLTRAVVLSNLLWENSVSEEYAADVASSSRIEQEASGPWRLRTGEQQHSGRRLQCIGPYDEVSTALQNAQDGAFVYVCPGIFIISSTLTVNGNYVNLVCLGGDHTCVYRKQGTGPIMRVNGMSFTLQGMRLENGAGSDGGAMEMRGGGTHTIKNCLFSGNSATNGGAVYSTSPVVLQNNHFAGNSASSTGGAGHMHYVEKDPSYGNTGSYNSAGRQCNDFYEYYSGQCGNLSPRSGVVFVTNCAGSRRQLGGSSTDYATAYQPQMARETTSSEDGAREWTRFLSMSYTGTDRHGACGIQDLTTRIAPSLTTSPIILDCSDVPDGVNVLYFDREWTIGDVTVSGFYFEG